ncbi:MAG: hypothetical protein LQ340_004636 [Diploschistes diacapsis]|nr:MAG: hypothetical protein LQ340_004636 [Diploschistes diacapsis]
MLDKSRSLLVDNVTYDLEDSVTPDRKVEARNNLRQFLEKPRTPNIKEQAIRINAVQTGLAMDDLTTVLQAPNIDAIVVPKVNTPSDLRFVNDVVQHIKARQRDAPAHGQNKPFKLIALIESAKAIMSLASICKVPHLDGLIFAAEDFALDLSLRRTPSLTEFLYARSAIATAARAHSLSSTIDLVCTSFRGDEGRQALEQECIGGRDLGFNGKQCIHPDQVETVQRVFAPDPKDLEWAVRVTIADKKASEQGRGAFTFQGKMIDAPVVGKAKAVVGRAEACGLDVFTIEEKWKFQEPE